MPFTAPHPRPHPATHPHSVKRADLDVPLTEELSGSLRQVRPRPKSALLHERVDGMVRRSALEFGKQLSKACVGCGAWGVPLTSPLSDARPARTPIWPPAEIGSG